MDSSLWTGQAVFGAHHFPSTAESGTWSTGLLFGGVWYQKTVEKRNIWQDFCLLNSSSRVCWQVFFFPLLFLHKGDPSLFSQVCVIPRVESDSQKEVTMTGKQCEVSPAPSAWLPSPAVFSFGAVRWILLLSSWNSFLRAVMLLNDLAPLGL